MRHDPLDPLAQYANDYRGEDYWRLLSVAAGVGAPETFVLLVRSDAAGCTPRR